MAQVSKRAVRLGLVALFAVALVALAYEMSHWYVHVYASNARVQTDLTSMSSRVDGTIERILVVEGDRVVAGQTLAQLEDDDIEFEIQTLQTDLALQEAQRVKLASEKRAFAAELGSRLSTERQQIKAAGIALDAVRNRLQLARRDLERIQVLYKKDLSSAKDFSAEQDRVLVLEGEAARAEAAVEIARRELEQVEATAKQLQVFDDQIRLSEITGKRIGTTIDNARVALSYRKIRSPIDGVIDRVYKHKGEYVEEGDRIAVLHDPQLLWLEANVDEKKIRHVRVGQTVMIYLQAQPYVEYTGKVNRIGSATASSLGLENQPSDRFGRPGDHLPVRIRILDPPAELAPGMLARINIRLVETMPLRSLFNLFRYRQTVP